MACTRLLTISSGLVSTLLILRMFSLRCPVETLSVTALSRQGVVRDQSAHLLRREAAKQVLRFRIREEITGHPRFALQCAGHSLVDRVRRNQAQVTDGLG